MLFFKKTAQRRVVSMMAKNLTGQAWDMTLSNF